MPRKSASKRQRPNRRGGSAAPQPMRLQRLLASAGFGSRRQCEELIELGRVEVDGETIKKQGTTVDPTKQEVRVDGSPLKKQRLVYYAVNKPVGFVTTSRDPQGRPRVIDLVPRDERVFPVGRLDRSSEGLILLTNDGELAQKLTHPKFGVRKVYRVTVAGKVDGETMKKMRRGIHIAEGFVKVEGAKLLKTRSRATEMEIVLREGKNREIRRILARLGHKVQHLRRIAVGPLRLGDVPSGAYRVVTHQEVEKLWIATETSAESQDAVRTGTRAGDARTGRKTATRGSGKPNRGEDSARLQTGRRPTKKSGPNSPWGNTKTNPEASESQTLGESRSRGAIIGGESTTPSEKKGKPKRGKKKTKRSSTRSGPSQKTLSRGRGSDAGQRSKPTSKKSATKRGGGKSKPGAKKKRPKT